MSAPADTFADFVEQLADEHLEVRLDRRDDDVRTAVLVPNGPGWEERLRATQ